MLRAVCICLASGRRWCDGKASPTRSKTSVARLASPPCLAEAQCQLIDVARTRGSSVALWILPAGAGSYTGERPEPSSLSAARRNCGKPRVLQRLPSIALLGAYGICSSTRPPTSVLLPRSPHKLQGLPADPGWLAAAAHSDLQDPHLITDLLGEILFPIESYASHVQLRPSTVSRLERLLTAHWGESSDSSVENSPTRRCVYKQSLQWIAHPRKFPYSSNKSSPLSPERT